MDATETGFDCLSCIRKKSFLFMFDLIEGVKFLEIKILKNLFNNFRLLDFWELKFYLMKRFVDEKSRIWFRYLHRIKLHLLRFDWIFLSAYTEWISDDRINFFELKKQECDFVDWSFHWFTADHNSFKKLRSIYEYSPKCLFSQVI